jgi:hypothetical protein
MGAHPSACAHGKRASTLACAVTPATCSKASTLCWATARLGQTFLHGNSPGRSLLRFHGPLCRRQLLFGRRSATSSSAWPSSTSDTVGVSWLTFRRRARVWRCRRARYGSGSEECDWEACSSGPTKWARTDKLSKRLSVERKPRPNPYLGQIGVNSDTSTAHDLFAVHCWGLVLDRVDTFRRGPCAPHRWR